MCEGVGRVPRRGDITPMPSQPVGGEKDMRPGIFFHGRLPNLQRSQMLLAHVDIFLERFRALCGVVAGNNFSSVAGELRGRERGRLTFSQIHVSTYSNFRRVCPTVPFVRRA